MGYEKDVAAIVKAIEDHKKAATYDPMALMKQNVKKKIPEEGEETPKPDNQEETDAKHHLTEVFLSKERQTILLSATLTKVSDNLNNILVEINHLVIITAIIVITTCRFPNITSICYCNRF